VQDNQEAWLSYALIMNLQIEGYNSIHNSTDDYKMTFELEREARGFLAEMWSQIKAENSGVSDKYLDDLLAVANSGFLSEYVYVYCRRDFWSEIPDLKMEEFLEWSAKNLEDHKVETLSKAVLL
jgi:hypothetical protein